MFMGIVIAIIIGLLSGYLSGQFGVGGGMITKPAIRIILQRNAFIALGTPLLVVIPAAFTGAIWYAKNRFIKFKLGINIAAFGIIGTLLGAYTTKFVNGDILMLATAFVMLIVALRFLGVSFFKEPSLELNSKPFLIILFLGLIVGFYSGFLGLGGGILIVPGLVVLLNIPIKQALGTSLFVVALMAIPGAIAHFFINHVDVNLAILIAAGAIPGAYLGSKVAIKMNEKALNVAFGIFLLVVAVYFGGFEILRLV